MTCIPRRFLQVDPIEGGNANDYAYVDDPVNDFDLDGKMGEGQRRRGARNGYACSNPHARGCSYQGPRGRMQGSLELVACPTFGCVKLAFDFGRKRPSVHFAGGMAVFAGVPVSNQPTACGARDEVFGSAGPVGASSTRRGPLGRWSTPSVSGGWSPVKFGGGLDHWWN